MRAFSTFPFLSVLAMLVAGTAVRAALSEGSGREVRQVAFAESHKDVVDTAFEAGTFKTLAQALSLRH